MMRFLPTRDADLIATLNRPIHEHHLQLMPSFFAPYDHSRIRDTIADTMKQSGHHFIIGKFEEEPIGYVWFEEIVSKSTAFRQQIRTLYVRQISILPTHKRNGFGRQMMEYVEQWAHAHDFASIELDYWVANKEASRFYDQMGFQTKRQIVTKHLRDN